MPNNPRNMSRAEENSWKLEDAKARFSELVRRAHDDGPQAVTVRGRRAVVVLAAEEYETLIGKKPKLAFVDFLENLHFEGVDLWREPDLGRETEL